MSEQQEQQPVILTIDDQEYDVNELGNDTKVHYVQVVNLRKQLGDLQNQITAAQQQSANLQAVLCFRLNSLIAVSRYSISIPQLTLRRFVLLLCVCSTPSCLLYSTFSMSCTLCSLLIHFLPYI